jgi:hypothetical protein
MTATVDFYKSDFGSTLFPLKTNLLMFENHSVELSDYIYQEILDDAKVSENFLSQQRVFATKPKGHLRRTVKLDPVAEYFVYDIAYRNRSIFRPQVSDSRRSFGYRFQSGTHIPIHVAYKEFRASIAEASKVYKFNLQFDIVTCSPEIVRC